MIRPVFVLSEFMSTPSYSFFPRYLSGQSAWASHTPFGYDLVKALAPATLVEIGTRNGDSFLSFCQSVQDHGLSTQCYSVNHWKGEEQTRGADELQTVQVDAYRAAHYSSFAFAAQSDYASASQQFDDGSIELLHIDGLHRYETISRDFDTWFPKVKNGGVILVHDILRHSGADPKSLGAGKFWEETQKKFTAYQLNHGLGLGILVKGSNPRIEEWLSQATGSESKHYYAHRGMDLTIIAEAKDQAQMIQRRDESIRTLQSELHEANVGISDHARLLANLQQSHATLQQELATALQSAATQHQEHARSYGKVCELDATVKKLTKRFKAERKLRQEADSNERKLRKFVEHWNGRSWFSRAFHKIRLPKKKQSSSPAAQ